MSTLENDLPGIQTDVPEKDNVFLRTVQKGYAADVIRLLQETLDNGHELVTSTNRKGETALYIAVDKGYVDIVRALLEYNAPVDTITKAKTTPLKRAKTLGNAEIIWMLYNALFMSRTVFTSVKTDERKGGIVDMRTFQTMETSDIEPLTKYIQQHLIHTVYFHNLNFVPQVDLFSAVTMLFDNPCLQYIDFGMGNVAAAELYIMMSQLLQAEKIPQEVTDLTLRELKEGDNLFLESDTDEEDDEEVNNDDTDTEDDDDAQLIEGGGDASRLSPRHFVPPVNSTAATKAPTTWWKRAIDEHRFTRYLKTTGIQSFSRIELEGVVLRRKYFLYVAACPLQYLLAPPFDHKQDTTDEGEAVRGPSQYIALAKKVVSIINREPKPSAITAVACLVDHLGRTPLRLAVDYQLKDVVACILGNSSDTGLFKVPVVVHDREGQFVYNYIYDYWECKVVALDNITPLMAAIIASSRVPATNPCGDKSCYCATLPKVTIPPGDEPTAIADGALIARMLLRSAIVDRPIRLNGHLLSKKDPSIKLPIPNPDEMTEHVDEHAMVPLLPFLSAPHRRRRQMCGAYIDRVGIHKTYHGRTILLLVLQYAPQILNDVLELHVHDVSDFTRPIVCPKVCHKLSDVGLKLRRDWKENGGTVMDVDDRGLSMLHWVVLRKHNTFLADLLSHKLDICAVTSTLQWTPLHYAVYSGGLETCHALLSYAKSDRGELHVRSVVDYNRNSEHITPLHLATSLGYLDIVSQLVELGGASVHIKNELGYDPHDIAVIMKVKHEKNAIPAHKDEWKKITATVTQQVQYFNSQPQIQNKLYTVAKRHFLSQAVVYLGFTLLLTIVANLLTRVPVTVWDSQSAVALHLREVRDTESFQNFVKGPLVEYLSSLTSDDGMLQVKSHTVSLENQTHMQSVLLEEIGTTHSPLIMFSYVAQGVVVFVTMLFDFDSFNDPAVEFSYARHRSYRTLWDWAEILLQIGLGVFVVMLFKEEVIDLQNACRTAFRREEESMQLRIAARKDHLKRTWRRCRGLMISLARFRRSNGQTRLEEILQTSTRPQNALRRNAFRISRSTRVSFYKAVVTFTTPKMLFTLSGSVRTIYQGVLEYLGKEWNSVDLTCIALWGYFLLLRIQFMLWFAHEKYLGSNSPTKLLQLQALFGSRENGLLSALVVLSWLKLLKYIQVLPHLGPVVTAIISTVTDSKIGIFMLVFLEVLCSFVAGFYLVFRAEILAFQTPLGSLMSVFRMIFGEWDYDAMSSAHDLLGPLLFVSCVVVANLILLNILIAVVANVYEENLQQCIRTWSWRIVDIYAEHLTVAMELKMQPFEQPVLSLTLINTKSLSSEDDNDAFMRSLLQQQSMTRGLLQELADLQQSDDAISTERDRIQSAQEDLKQQLQDAIKKKQELEALLATQISTSEARLKEETKQLKLQHKEQMLQQTEQRRVLDDLTTESNSCYAQMEELKRQLKDSQGRESRLREALDRAKELQRTKESELELLQAQVLKGASLDDESRRNKVILGEYQNEMQQYKGKLNKAKEIGAQVPTLPGSPDTPRTWQK